MPHILGFTCVAAVASETSMSQACVGALHASLHLLCRNILMGTHTKLGAGGRYVGQGGTQILESDN